MELVTSQIKKLKDSLQKIEAKYEDQNSNLPKIKSIFRTYLFKLYCKI